MLGLKDVSDLTRVLVAQSHGILMAYGNNELQFNAEVRFGDGIIFDNFCHNFILF